VQASTAPKQAIATDELADQLGALCKYVMVTTGREVFQVIEELELSFSQLKAAQALADAEAPLSLGALGEELGLSLPAVSRAVDGLVRRGLCTRTEDPTDRRSKRVVLTKRGRRFYERVYALRAAGIRDFVERLEPEEREALAQGLNSIAGREEIRAHSPRR
jgi:DNA-binding MarR family transcriptional regulator